MRRMVFIVPLLLLLSVAIFKIKINPIASASENKSCGFVQNVYGQRISWKGNLPIPMYIHESVPKEAYEPIKKAMLSWEKSLGRKLFYIAGTDLNGPKAPRKDGKNVIYWFGKGEWNFASSEEQARTNVFWVGDQIKEADIKINNDSTSFFTNSPKSVDDIDLESVVLHELGHVLGLTHEDNAGSIMASELASRTMRRNLSGQDKRLASCEY